MRMPTFSGKLIDPANIQTEDINIVDIAQGLSMRCRYNGQCRKFYSVAEHSVKLAQHIKEQVSPHEIEGDLLTKVALLHDAHEAYIGDVTRPVQMMLKESKPELDFFIRDLKTTIQSIIHYRFDIPGPVRYSIIEMADTRIALDEWPVLFPGKPDGPIDGVPKSAPRLGVKIECWDHKRAGDEFLRMFNSLHSQTGI